MPLELLHACPLFAGLDENDIREVDTYLIRSTYKPGDIIFRAGDVGDTMHFVESGQVRIISADTHDRTILARYGPGDFFGEITLLLTQNRSATAIVSIDATLWSLNQDNLHKLIQEHPNIALQLSRELSRRVIASSDVEHLRYPPYRLVLVANELAEGLAHALCDLTSGSVAIVALTGQFAASQPLGRHTDQLHVIHAHITSDDQVADLLSRELAHHDFVLPVMQSTPGVGALKAAKIADAAIIGEGAPPFWLTSAVGDDPIWPLRDGDYGRMARTLARRSVGLALSSGGARGIAHIGVIKALREANIPVDMIAGSNMGAVFGTLLAIGWDTARMEAFARTLHKRMRFWRQDYEIPPRSGLIRGKRLWKMLDAIVNSRTFADLALPLYIVAADIHTGEEVVFNAGPLADALRATLSMPFMLSPWQHEGRYLVDGTVVNPLPASILRDLGAGVIIGANAVPLRKDMKAVTRRRVGMLGIISRVLNITEWELLNTQLALTDVAINCGVQTDVTDFREVDQAIALGEQATHARMAAIRVQLGHG